MKATIETYAAPWSVLVRLLERQMSHSWQCEPSCRPLHRGKNSRLARSSVAGSLCLEECECGLCYLILLDHKEMIRSGDDLKLFRLTHFRKEIGQVREWSILVSISANQQGRFRHVQEESWVTEANRKRHANKRMNAVIVCSCPQAHHRTKRVAGNHNVRDSLAAE